MEIERIHIQFHRILLNYIATRVSNRDDAADILQEVFIKIASKLNTLTSEEKLKSWIFAITRNAIIDYYRKKANTDKLSITEEIINKMEVEEAFDTTKGLDKCIWSFIQKLPVEYRDIIIDSEIKNIKQKDLVEKYNLAYSSVRSRVQRGRIRLKEILLNCCLIESDRRGNVLKVISKNNCGDECGDCG